MDVTRSVQFSDGLRPTAPEPISAHQATCGPLTVSDDGDTPGDGDGGGGGGGGRSTAVLLAVLLAGAAAALGAR